MSEITAGVLAEVLAERARQDAKWGEQNHPDLDPRDIDSVTRNEYSFRASRWTEINEERATPSRTPGLCFSHPDAPHTHTAWDGILLEEVYEALAEEDLAKLRAELIQVAAVAAAWVEAIDRRTGSIPPSLIFAFDEHGVLHLACSGCGSALVPLGEGDELAAVLRAVAGHQCAPGGEG